MGQVIQDCHANQSLYNVLGLEKVYNISSLGSWRSTWGLGTPLSSLGSANNMRLEGVVLLSKDAEVDLKQLSKSPLASLNPSQFSPWEVRRLPWWTSEAGEASTDSPG